MVYVAGYIWVPTPKWFARSSQIYCDGQTILVAGAASPHGAVQLPTDEAMAARESGKQ